MGVISVSATGTSNCCIRFQSKKQSQLLIRGLFSAARRGAFSISTRTQDRFPQQRILCFGVNSVVPMDVLTAEKEEAKAVLTMYLKEVTGLNDEAVAATLGKSDHFIEHLLARLYSIHKTWNLVGRALTRLEIRDALIPYLEHLCEEHGGSLDHVMEIFCNLPDTERKDHRDSLSYVVEDIQNQPEEEQEQDISEASPGNLLAESIKLKAMARVAEIGTDGQLPSITHDLLDIGLDMDQIKEMARKWPPIARPSWVRNIKPLVEFLLELGVPASNIPIIFYKTPHLCSCTLSKNILPSMAYLEALGFDKSKWAKVICRCPTLLTRSRQKVEATVDYLYELGISKNRIGKVFTRFPQITDCSIEDNLRPTVEYFKSMGVNIEFLIGQYPQVLGRSVECTLKPRTEFFLDRGFSIVDIGTIASRFGIIYCMSLTKNLIPKWDFFLTMDYPISELVKYPSYFGYSLEGRIKPRYAEMKECDVKLSFGYLFGSSDSTFQKFLNRSVKKRLVAKLDSINVPSDNARK